MDLKATLRRHLPRTTTADLSLGLAAIATLVLALTGWAVYFVVMTEAERNLHRQADALADELAQALSPPMQTLDLDTLSQIADAYRYAQNFAGLAVTDETGQVLYGNAPGEIDLVQRTRSITSGGQALGRLDLWLTRRPLRVVRESVLAGTALAILAAILGIIAATHLLLWRFLDQPLHRLTIGIDHITAGHYEATLAPAPQADINLVITKINAMAQQIADRDAILRQREEEFRQVVASISDHVYFAEITPAGQFRPRYLSPRLAQLTGYPLRTFFDDPTFWREQIVFPDDRAAVRAESQRQAAGQNSEVEYRLQTRTGQMVWVRDSARVETWGTTRFIYGVISNITARKRAEQVQAATYRISEAALTAPSLEELYSSLHAIIGELMPAQNFYIALYHTPTNLLHFVYHADEHDLVWEPIQPDRTLTGYVLQNGKSLLVNAEAFEQMIQVGEVDLVGPPSQDWLGVPLKTQQATIGVMVVQIYGGAARLGDTDRDILTFVSTQVAMAIERRQAEAALRLDEARLDALAKLNEMTGAPEKAITDFALAEAVRLTKSAAGWLGRLNEAEDQITMFSWVGRSVRGNPAAQLSPSGPMLPQGDLAEVIRQRRPVVVNNPVGEGLPPEGASPEHVAVRRHILAPIFEGPRMVMMAAVGNKDDPYDEADVRQLTLLMEGMWRLLQRRRAMAEIRQLNADLEQRVEARTAELSARTAQLGAANQELEAFAYSVSHDLRGPLRGINGFSQALLEDYGSQLEAEAQGMLHRIRAATERMAQLIDDLLKLSRVTRSEIQLADVDLCQLVQEATAELRAAHAARQMQITLPAECRTVRADANLMRIALDNLLDNAWKFTRQREEGQIEFGYREQADQTVFFLRDNGAGFDNTYSDKLFGAFQRLHATGEFEGTGIGLAIVQRIIRRHGGQVWAEGAVDQGATFYFSLPK